MRRRELVCGLAAGQDTPPLGHPATLPEEAPEGDVRFQSRRFSYVDGSFRVDPARLPLKHQVVKGYEYAVAEGEITGPVPILLSRWSSIRPAAGWSTLLRSSAITNSAICAC